MLAPESQMIEKVDSFFIALRNFAGACKTMRKQDGAYSKLGRRAPALMLAPVVDGSRVGAVLVKMLGGASLAAGEVPITHIVVS
jgi:hypothetical protein